MSIKENLNKLVSVLNDETFLSTYTSIFSFQGADIIDSNDDLLKILGLVNIGILVCGNPDREVKLNVTPNSIIIPYNVVSNESEYFVCVIDDDYFVNIYDICESCVYTYYEKVMQLDLQSIMVYEKMKRMRGAK